MHLVQTVDAALEPLSLADAKLHAYIDITATDSLVTALITVARRWVEQFCSIALITQSWSVTYDFCDSFEGLWWHKRGIRLPQSPIQSIEAITTYDNNNTSTIFDVADYRLSGDRVILNDNASWSSNLRLYDSLKIDFTCGFGDTADKVPPSIILAMKMLVAQWYEQRGAITDDILATGNMQMLPVPFGVNALLSKYKVPVLA